MKISALHVLLLVMILAQGCGFHLRGQSPGVQADRGYSIHIRAAATSQLAAAVKSQLAGSNVNIRDNMEGADYALTLHDEEFDRQVLSVSAETGKVEEYQVVFTSHISVSKVGGEQLVDAQIIRVTGDYTFDEEAALGKFAEEEAIKEELIGQAATQIIRRLNALTRP